jgi:hypothetical protein
MASGEIAVYFDAAELQSCGAAHIDIRHIEGIVNFRLIAPRLMRAGTEQYSNRALRVRQILKDLECIRTLGCLKYFERRKNI